MERKTSLIIMAAGLGSRYGRGIKQLDRVGPTGETIMDYSVHDAVEAGFGKIVIVIRKDIEDEFRSVTGDRIGELCAAKGAEVSYVFQDIGDLPGGLTAPEGRTKPWGTGAAVLSCRDVIRGPFAVINADDYYGKTAFRRIRKFLSGGRAGRRRYCMAGYALSRTLSDNGSVNRGICRIRGDGYLMSVAETPGIVKTPEGAAIETRLGNGQREHFAQDPNAPVSMNMWGFTPDFFPLLERGFIEFLEEHRGDADGEFLIPVFVNRLLKEGKISVRVLPTEDSWFGVTYSRDRAEANRSILRLIEMGEYSRDLFADWQPAH
ncbi:MAG: hypothetical protein VZQ84_03590 [Anaerovoracaceae bacterium]|nr:hypothetical protein [Anaerovoracaceae bacterium]